MTDIGKILLQQPKLRILYLLQSCDLTRKNKYFFFKSCLSVHDGDFMSTGYYNDETLFVHSHHLYFLDGHFALQEHPFGAHRHFTGL